MHIKLGMSMGTYGYG